MTCASAFPAPATRASIRDICVNFPVQEGGKQLHCGVGAGKERLEFAGTGNVGYGRE